MNYFVPNTVIKLTMYSIRSKKNYSIAFNVLVDDFFGIWKKAFIQYGGTKAPDRWND